TFQINLPPLRTRSGDVTELAYAFMSSYCRDRRVPEKEYSTEFLLVLRRYDWPGNVRELFSSIERAYATATDSPVLLPIHLPTSIRIRALENMKQKSSKPATGGRDAPEAGGPALPLSPLQEVREAAIEKTERDYLRRLMAESLSIESACQTAALSRSRLYALLKKYHIPAAHP
ncbi:MAG: sigma-54-dependent Fis family transcriptional regulator, partial [Thermodesulfobacteriota bacterium]